MEWIDKFKTEKQKIKKKAVSKRVKGAELVLTGGALFFSQFLLKTLAPLALSAYGLYRWFIRKNYPQGVMFTASGVLLFFLMRWTPLGWVLWIPSVAGIGLMLYGGFQMLRGDKNKELEE